jgi:23S rRNA pseudouridine1911/1915/1917 synthase
VTDLVAVEVPPALAGERVDKVVSFLTGLSRRAAAELVVGGRVKIDGSTELVRSRVLASGQLLELDTAGGERQEPVADRGVEFGVVHEDDSLVVVDKPAGLVVHAGAGNRSGTLVCGLLARYPELALLPAAGAGEPDRPGIVHRLDKGTSGLLVVARTVDAYRSLSGQFKAHSARRSYEALVFGTVQADRGTIDAPIGRSTRKPDRMAVTAAGRAATTSYSVIERYEEPVRATLLEATLGTGRTHQVRVHFAAIGHPVFGDDRYGRGTAVAPELKGRLERGRLFLHAAELRIEHPLGGTAEWTSPLPQDLRDLLAQLD